MEKKAKRGSYYKSLKSRREARIAYACILPFFIYMAFWGVIPLIYGLFLGLTEYNGLVSRPKFIGLQNFIDFFTTGNYLLLLWRQFWIGALCLVANTVVSFIVALALNVKSKARGFFRTAVYVPAIAAVSVTSGIWVALLDVNGGINNLLKAWGMEPIAWNYSQFWMVVWVVIYFLWRSLGPAAIIWLGGLQSIDPTLYEAADIDGANRWQKIRYITLPGLKFIASYIILTGIIGTMQMFDVIMFITNGNPYGKTDVLMYRIYRDGVVNFNLGMAGAESTILGLVTICFALIYFYVKVRKEDD